MAHDVDGFVLVSMPKPPAAQVSIDPKFEKVKETVDEVKERLQDLQRKVERAIDEVDGRKFAKGVAKAAALWAFSTAFPVTAVVVVPAASYLHGKVTKEVGDGIVKVTSHIPSTK